MNNYGRSKNMYSAGLVSGNISYHESSTPNSRKLRDSQLTFSSGGGENSSSFSFSGNGT